MSTVIENNVFNFYFLGLWCPDQETPDEQKSLFFTPVCPCNSQFPSRRPGSDSHLLDGCFIVTPSSFCSASPSGRERCHHERTKPSEGHDPFKTNPHACFPHRYPSHRALKLGCGTVLYPAKCDRKALTCVDFRNGPSSLRGGRRTL